MKMTETEEAREWNLSCPIPRSSYPRVLLAHGGGGRLMHDLIQQMFLPAFRNDLLESLHDGAVFEINGARLAFTTDSYVVHPTVFPGSDIGKLAVFGTVNDLAMCGARPLFLSIAFILEEGLEMEFLWSIVRSMRSAAEEANVRLVTGDTKVVDRGKGDGIFINTTGIGVVAPGVSISPSEVRAGDRVILNGDIGRHGIAVMTVREGLGFDSPIVSDCAPLHLPALALLDAGVPVHCLRDLTRGGMASALCEIASSSELHIEIDERAIPVEEPVRAACEILGLDPLYVANEGRFVAFVPPEDADRALAILQQHEVSRNACIIGTVLQPDSGEGHTGVVTLKSTIGTTRILTLLTGEQLPRIC